MYTWQQLIKIRQIGSFATVFQIKKNGKIELSDISIFKNINIIIF